MDFNGMTVADIDALLGEAKEARKLAVAREQLEADRLARAKFEGVAEGTLMRIVFKGEETDATFVKLTDKRLTVEVDGVNKSILFNKVVKVY